ncbi:MAG: hypothetical protein ACOY3P_26475 [Planctomycetota bacterium]
MKHCVILLGLASIVAGLAWRRAPAANDSVEATAASIESASESGASPARGESDYLAPAAIQCFDRGRKLLVLGSNGRRAHVVDLATGRLERTIPLPAPATGAAVRGDSAYITTAEPAGRVLIVDLPSGTVQKQFRVGHTPMSPVLSADGQTLYVANRFNNSVGFVELSTGAQRSVEVIREPVAMALTPDGRRLFVANHLPCVRPFLDDENPLIAAEVSVIDTAERRVLNNIELPNGSQGLRGIALSPDSRYAVVTHILSHYTIPPMQIEHGAINMNALSILDAQSMEWIDSVMLDDPHAGAANPWGVCFSADGQRLLVTHAGTHELSVIDFPKLIARVSEKKGASGVYGKNALAMMAGIRQRVRLPAAGPRAVCEIGGWSYVAGYFSDDLAAFDLKSIDVQAEPVVRRIELEKFAEHSPAREGERYFNDASLCFEQWQSCGSCHPDGRSDALYWDLLNDGMGNTKDTKNLLMAALTPPVMWRGVRADAGMAVRAGIHHIQFVEPKPEQAEAIEAYLTSMKSVPSPHLNADVLEFPKTDDASCSKCHNPGVPRGSPTESARRGKAIFEGKAGCATCHPHPTFTAMREVDPGLGSGVPYDIPSLVEVWRTAPYLHNSEALSLEEAITDYNFLEKRGRTKDLSEQELEDLLEYLKSL